MKDRYIIGKAIPAKEGNIIIGRACPPGCKPKWISVKDKLPESNIVVLVWNPFGLSTGMYKGTHWHFNEDAFEALQDPVNYYSDWDDSLPTHWMPLPEPPQE